MAKAKRKTLPKDFQDTLKTGNLADIEAVFETCDVNARGGFYKATALAFNDVPDNVVRWLVAKGADISAADIVGQTPLHARAGHWQGRIEILLELGADVNSCDLRGDTPLHKAASVGNAHCAEVLLAHGASVEAQNNNNLTPLELALQCCSNTNIPAIVRIAELLLPKGPSHKAGARSVFSRWFQRADPARDREEHISIKMREFVRRIGENFEFHRSGFNIQTLDATSAALDRLYALFEVPPVPHRILHDGKSQIVATAVAWEDQHQELWKMLVPSSGAANTVQGEVIRISGRLAREIDGNGGINWDKEFARMADALLLHFGSSKPLSDSELREAKEIVGDIKHKSGDTRRLCQLAVNWVILNPSPAALAPPSYRL